MLRESNDNICLHATCFSSQALQFSKNKTDLSRKNDVFEISLKRKRDPTVDDDDEDADADADGDEVEKTASMQEKD